MKIPGSLNAARMPIARDGTRPWSHGLHDVGPVPGLFALSCMLPCVAYGRNTSRRYVLAQSGAPHPRGGSACGGDCCIFAACCLLPGGQACLLGESRHLTRTRYEINGGGCADDVVQPCCCMPCVLTQEARELQLEEESFAQANGKPA